LFGVVINIGLISTKLYLGAPLYPQKAKSSILTYFLFQGILGLPLRSWLTPSYRSIFLYFQGLGMQKDLIDDCFSSTKSLFSLAYSLIFRLLFFAFSRSLEVPWDKEKKFDLVMVL